MVVWLRLYPTLDVRGVLFGVSDTTAPRAVGRVLPLREAAGRDAMRVPDPGRTQRRDLGAVLGRVPELAVVIDRPAAPLTPPPAGRVEPLMREWVDWIRDESEGYNPIVAAVIAHHGFEAAHPFVDGNGRVGRLLLNLLLMRAGYPPALLLRDWRLGYLQALNTANSDNYTPLAILVGRAVDAGLDLYLDACAAMPEEGEYRPLAELARDDAYTAAHLGWLVRKGRLEAVKRGGRWYSTPEAIARYRVDVEQGVAGRGPPPREREAN